MPFEEVEAVFPPVWDWDENPILEGIFRGVEEKNTKYGTSKMYYVTPTGEQDQVAFWGSAVLDNKMGQITAPAMIRVSFEGTERSEKGNAVKQYTVLQDSSWDGAEDDIPF
jgi:hypothetical protein